ncbi:unnamed protein product, partial [Amoebophrya sp. A120]
RKHGTHGLRGVAHHVICFRYSGEWRKVRKKNVISMYNTEIKQFESICRRVSHWTCIEFPGDRARVCTIDS